MTNGEKFKEIFGFGADGSRVIAVNATWWDCEFLNRKSVTKKEKEGNMTKADIIRQLNDDELAILLYFATWESEKNNMSIDQWLKWLKEEVEDGSV